MAQQHASRNIDAVHRGFLYQHLVGAAALLCADVNRLEELVVEGDEDIELQLRSGLRRYIQVKTRSGRLRPGDIATALTRFAQLKKEHDEGQRPGTPEFVIFCNAAVATEVDDVIALSAVAVTVVAPDTASVQDLPPAWRNLEEAVQWCSDAASRIPFGTLAPSTLVWKLAAEVAFACTGERREGHSFKPAALPELFEQLVKTLHHFPSPPVPYLPLEHEPPFTSSERLRLIVGFSGAGKTAWAAEGNLHSGLEGVYVNAADVPDPALASAVAREVAANLLATGVNDARAIVAPGVQPFEALRILSEVIPRAGRKLCVVVDNVHRSDAESVRRIVDALASCQFILLAQPWPQLAALQATLSVSTESIPGFSLASIAAEFVRHSDGIDVATADRVMKLTGGLPLFVRDAALLAQRYYAGSAALLCDDLDNATNAMTTGQEAILAQVVGRLSPAARDAFGLLGLSDIPLAVNEVGAVTSTVVNGEVTVAMSILRELSAWGIVQHFGDGSLRLHDAFGILSLQHRATLSSETLFAARRALADALRKSFGPGQYERLVMFLKVAPLIGETEAVIDVVSGMGEHLQERGKAAELLRIVDAAADDATVPAQDRFWAADAALFWTLDGYSDEDVERRVAKLEANFGQIVDPPPLVRSALLLKQLLFAGRRGRLDQVRAVYAELHRITVQDDMLDRIRRYDYAAELYRCDAADAAYCVLAGLVGDYFRAIGLSPRDLFMKNPQEIQELLRDDVDHDELKRLADTLDLISRVVNELGASSGVLRIWAHKLYLLASAHRSAVKVGQDVVDELLFFADPASARRMIENTLIPLIRDSNLLAYMVPVQAQYAIVLAYMGEFDRARTIFDQLEYFRGASPERDAELKNQRELIDAIEQGVMRLRMPPPGPGYTSLIQAIERSLTTRGRNDTCVCGSNLKFKRCCGRATFQPLAQLLLPHAM